MFFHSDRCAIHPSTWRHWRYAPAALLPLLPHRHRYLSRWGALLGYLEACAAARVRVPPRADEGGTQGWNGRHTGEAARRRSNSESYLFFAVLKRKCRMNARRLLVHDRL
jgi:hypothetical protein